MRVVLILDDRLTAEQVEASLAAVGMCAKEMRDMSERYPVYRIEPIPALLRQQAE